MDVARIPDFDGDTLPELAILSSGYPPLQHGVVSIFTSTDIASLSGDVYPYQADYTDINRTADWCYFTRLQSFHRRFRSRQRWVWRFDYFGSFEFPDFFEISFPQASLS